VLDTNPLIIRAAQENDVALEPVFQDSDGQWMVPSFNYKEKKADWQRVLDSQISKPRWGDE
jgi:hypothetical protein